MPESRHLRDCPEGMTMKNEIMLCMHAGSGNHGCEAIAESLLLQMKSQPALPLPAVLVTNSAAEDLRYGLGSMQNVCRIVEEKHIAGHPAAHAFLYAWRKLSGDRESFLRYRFSGVTGKHAPGLSVSVGGDNYCYPSMIPDLILADRMLERQGTASMLLGCSIEPELLRQNADLAADMLRFRRIIARESRTFEALRKAGVPADRLELLPDPAFTLPAAEPAQELQKIMEDVAGSGAVGLNLSPMALEYAKNPDAALNGYRHLIRHILDTTDKSVLLIPHVVWDRSDDRQPLDRLFREFRESGRVFSVPDASASELKKVISGCDLFIGARTHATIAAYSSMVPTLVIGYSVKAAGIAEDLFGTAEHYVLPVQELTDESQITAAYEWLLEHASEMRGTLRKNMPEYAARAAQNGARIAAVYKEIGEDNGTRFRN